MKAKLTPLAPTSPSWSARICIVTAAALFSTGGAAIKSCPFGALETGGLRSIIAAAGLMVLMPAVRRRWTRQMFLVGIAYATTMLLFVAANKLTTAAATIFLESTAPLYVVGFGALLFGARPSRSDLRLLGLVAVGFFMFGMGQETPTTAATNPTLGNWLAAAAGVSWALTIMGLHWLKATDSDGFDGMRAVTIGNLLAGAVGLLVAWPLDPSGLGGWLAVAYLGLVQTVLAYVFLLRGLKEVTALETSLLLLAEPALTPIWALLLHDERPVWTTLAGGGFILMAAGQQVFRGGRKSTIDSSH